MTTHQARRAALRPYREKAPVVPPSAPCGPCGHPRSSHNTHVLLGRCAVVRCDCLVYDPRCGCGHLLSLHSWGTPPDPWGCAGCICKGFGAMTEEALKLFD